MYLVFDLETSSDQVHKRVANPFFNRILCIGLKYQNKQVISLEQDYMPNDWLKDVNALIGHNIKFDLLYIWKNQELQQAFKNGLTIWDTQLAEYMLTAQQHKYPALRDIAVNKYGCKERTKYIEEGFKQGLKTTDMDINLLLQDVQGDVLNTETVAIQQVIEAKRIGMYNLIKAQMDGLLATTEMEYNGMKIHKEELEKNQFELEVELGHTQTKLSKLIGKYWNENI